MDGHRFAESAGLGIASPSPAEEWVGLRSRAPHRYVFGLVGIYVCRIGTVDASIASPREVYRFCLRVNAPSAIVAHNHPSGNPEPSREDVLVTKQLVEAGKLMGIPGHDHIILAGAGYTSLAERGLM